MVRLHFRRKPLAIAAVFIGLFLLYVFFKRPKGLYIGVKDYPPLNDSGDKSEIRPQRQDPLICGARIPVQNADIKVSELYKNFPSNTWWHSGSVDYSMDQWKDHKLEVVILPHSHHDPGWRMTFRKYLNTKAKPILDSTLNFLHKNKEARFIYAEVSFLDAWWSEMTAWQKTTFKRLLQEGQWEIATGGWVMNDEASTHYAATAAQLAEGQHWLMDNLGYFPNVSWAIDPFGHGTTDAYLKRKAGLEHILIHRTHYEIKGHFGKKRTLEFRWRQPWDSSGSTDVFCHMLPYAGYGVQETCGPSPGVCWQFDFSRQSWFQFPWSPPRDTIDSDNVATRAKALADQYRQKASLYDNGGVVFVPLGDDFRYPSEFAWESQMSNYKKLMDYINSKPEMRMHVQFGTLSTYFNLVKQRKPITSFPSLIGDFFTYADRNEDYWSGYFTSRPTHKALSRVVEAELRSAEILFSLARHWQPNLASELNSKTCRSLYDNISSARRSLALFQHHDAITGTARRHVMTDYRRELSSALDNSRYVAGASLVLLLGAGQQDVENAVHNQVLHWGSVLLHSAGWDWSIPGAPACPIITFTSLDQVRYLVLFNNHAHQRDHIVRVDIDLRKVLRTDANKRRLLSVKVTYGGDVNSQGEFFHQLQPSPDQISSEWGGSHAKSAYLFCLRTGPIPLLPLQILQLSLRLQVSDFNEPSIEMRRPVLYNIAPERIAAPWLHNQVQSNPLSAGIKNKQVELAFSPKTGFLQSMKNMVTGVVYPLAISFGAYKSMQAEDTSGAYLFKPELPSVPLPLSSQPKIRVARSKLVDEITTYHPNLVHTVRSYKTGNPAQLAIEVENILDLSSPNDNHEVVMRLSTGINNTNRVFFTDSNCLQFIRRVYYEKIPLQGNIYPMTCAAYIEAGGHRITLLSAQSLGFLAGEHPGEMTVWLDRRLAQGDGRGLGEGVMDNVPARSVFRILVETVPASSPDDPLGSNPLPGLTQEAQLVLNDLTYPTSQFVFSSTISTNLKQMRTSLLLMRASGLPPDYELVALKSFYSTSERFPPDLHSTPGSQLGILLHRTLPYCGKTYLCSQCSPNPFNSSSLSSGQVEVSELFVNLPIQRALRTPLTFIPKQTQKNEGKEIPTTSLSVQPMELEAYLLLPEKSKIP